MRAPHQGLSADERKDALMEQLMGAIVSRFGEENPRGIIEILQEARRRRRAGEPEPERTPDEMLLKMGPLGQRIVEARTRIARCRKEEAETRE